MRRSTFSDQPVTYGAVGATQAPDLLRYPPGGYRPFSREVRLGSGDERFRLARESLMAWGVQRGASMAVQDVQRSEGDAYRPVDFDASGQPVRAAARLSGQNPGEDGRVHVEGGMTATLSLRLGPFRLSSPVRVVYVIDEARRAGFAYGTLPGHQLHGEESFVVDYRDDDSVWLVVRSFSRPAGSWRALPSPVLRRLQSRLTTRYLRALLPGRAG